MHYYLSFCNLLLHTCLYKEWCMIAIFLKLANVLSWIYWLVINLLISFHPKYSIYIYTYICLWRLRNSKSDFYIFAIEPINRKVALPWGYFNDVFFDDAIHDLLRNYSLDFFLSTNETGKYFLFYKYNEDIVLLNGTQRLAQLRYVRLLCKRSDVIIMPYYMYIYYTQLKKFCKLVQCGPYKRDSL